MRAVRLLIPFIVNGLFLISSAAQQTPPSIIPSPQRDPQAISILQKSLAAMGADRLPEIADLTISGQIVQQRALDKATGTILVKMMGPERCRRAHGSYRERRSGASNSWHRRSSHAHACGA